MNPRWVFLGFGLRRLNFSSNNILVSTLRFLAGPLIEIDFWRERNAVLSGLYEQLNLPHVKKMVAVVELASTDQNLLASYKTHFGELQKASHNMLCL